eukprot:CAMPEP_0176351872 /NCGR_PEP_ID=MMETSP0126-20121128/10577_1 /TAXON_ID=141414 ORGANISM="Strombidinopsis acuminatum, Strain SPMC142" /NCGR_SAMPLE_ID=MMETSP0126 /ASSEMBLY_ACC=CAM_ASM_000229 /LENGTH=50 /DNA_ID=CAMNT_0017702653 /DNA_START=504 /DNA_END=656 /DNA_ORIENTATION=-
MASLVCNYSEYLIAVSVMFEEVVTQVDIMTHDERIRMFRVQGVFLNIYLI